MQYYFKFEIYLGRVLAINQNLTTDKLPTLNIKTQLRRQSYFWDAKMFRYFRQSDWNSSLHFRWAKNSRVSGILS